MKGKEQIALQAPPSVPSHISSEQLAMGRQTETSFWSRAQHFQATWHWIIHITTAESSNIYVTYRLYDCWLYYDTYSKQSNSLKRLKERIVGMESTGILICN